jgi:hypothetical protein
MASSVSSERAFSQGGITITKHRNRLKGDIVEALQCVKCAIRHDLLFPEPQPSSCVEMELESEDEGEGEDDPNTKEKEEDWEDVDPVYDAENAGWDEILLSDGESDAEGVN